MEFKPLRRLSATLALLLLAACDKPPAFHATDISGAAFGRLAALETLAKPDGRRLASADISGRAVMVFFGYTHCPDICPTALSGMKAAMDLLGSEADRVQVLFVTVDPERDTPEVLDGYVPWFDKHFVGLRGDPEDTRKAAEEFRVYYAKVKGSSTLDYSIDHSATSYAYDPSGRLRLLFRHGETPQHIADDLRRLLKGE